MKKILFTMLILSILSSCRKDSDITEVIDTQDPITVKNVESSITGRVFGSANEPLANSTIEINGKKYITDQNGCYFVSTFLNENGNYISASKDGYFTSGKFTFARLGRTDYSDIYLSKKPNALTFNSSESRRFDFTGGYVSFQSNSIVDENNNSYSGDVQVFAKIIDPNDLDKTPGDFRGIAINNNSFFASTFNIVAIELQSPNGKKLNINSNKPATIGLDIQPNVATKPNQISLCYFNEKNGNWVEEGSANLEGNQYVGKVSHFTFWAASQLKKYFRLSGVVTNDQNEVLSNMKVKIISSTKGYAEDQTNNQGYFDGFVPADENLKLLIIDNCGNNIYNKDIQPLTADLDLNILKVTLKNNIKIEGKLVDCSNNAIKNGIVYIFNSNGSTLASQKSETDGSFSINFSNCDGSKMYLVGYDFDNPSQSNQINLLAANNHLNTGNILVCNSLDEYVVVKYNGYTKVFSGNFTHDFNLNPLGIKLINPTPTDDFQMEFEPTTVNSAEMKKIICGFDTGGMIIQSIYCDFCSSRDCSQNDKLNLNNVAKPGEYTSGYLEGNYKSIQSGNILPYRIDFKVKRDN